MLFIAVLLQTKLLQQCFLFFIVVVIPGHNLGNSQVSVNRTIGPTLVHYYFTHSVADLQLLQGVNVVGILEAKATEHYLAM